MTAILDRPPHWSEQALCAQTDPEVFYPQNGGSGIAEARAICELCDVRAECLADALSRGDQHGVWGGLSLRQRRQHPDYRPPPAGWPT